MTEVPGVVGVKHRSGVMKLHADLLIQAAPDRRIYTAVDALLYTSFTHGAHGAIAAILTAAPKASVELWKAVEAGEHAKAHDLHQRLLPLWNANLQDNLPANTTYAQRLQGCPSGLPRAPMPPTTDVQKSTIRSALEGLGAAIDTAA